ncbi:hypothetical protein E0M27_25730 [Bacillus mycoides]|uniref:AAA family ATPase n=1 Tax=Bacillus mycoides TaxID=1405 RepID=UPI00103F1B93|nr:AAA family ATPase [Bacillus mycoides]MBJ7996916.1 kinase [Bacillus cereus]QWH85063.1 hypothetical protein EXW46_20180 [Bacillus mycoides]QWI93166.1 kinase [Bacillus mycoides]TBX52093.1 hypothetical protein E0M27_25730 [Bacillus mycoides]UNJ93530.1 AAA family ATPase [Bacillus mycoides]
MKSTLIILRGNSASGKTTIAKELQEHFGQGTLLVSQDVVRRDMLKVHDTMGNLSHDLLFEITKYGKGKCERLEFGKDLLSKWYNPHDTIEVNRETVFTDDFTQKDIFHAIITDITIQK